MNTYAKISLVLCALGAIACAGSALAAKPADTAKLTKPVVQHTGRQPWAANPPSRIPPGAVNRGGRWEEYFQGRGSVTRTRCQGMSRGPNCITAASRKEAARRAAAARAAAHRDTAGKGGQ